MIRSANVRLSTGRRRKLTQIARNYDLYLLLLPAVAFIVVFKYVPMYGVQLAFKDFSAKLGIFGSPLVGLKHFSRFFSGYHFRRILFNTLGISLYQLIAGFPVPIILALALNEVRNGAFKKSVQMITYAPHFLSTVVMCGMVITFLNPEYGIINTFIEMLGGESIYFITKPEYFKTIYVSSGIWQNMGWSSIIYIAALSNVSQELHEAAIMDGASRLKRIWHINVPCILPTVIILLILNTGKIMEVGFEKVFLLQNSLNMESSDVIATYVYRSGIVGAQFSFATAVGLFNSVVNFAILVSVNRISKRFSETSLW